MSGESQAKMYVKPKGSAGVLDPIDQRQSIGFKINSVGFGSIRTEAIVDYMCVPTQANLIPDIITPDIGFVGPDEPEYVLAPNQRTALLASVGKLSDELAEAQAEFYEMTMTSAAGSTSGSTLLVPSIAKTAGQSYFVYFTDDEAPLYKFGQVLPGNLQATLASAITNVAAGGKANVALYIVDDITSVIVHSASAVVVPKA
jgi:hypothetical protein